MLKIEKIFARLFVVIGYIITIPIGYVSLLITCALAVIGMLFEYILFNKINTIKNYDYIVIDKIFQFIDLPTTIYNNVYKY